MLSSTAKQGLMAFIVLHSLKVFQLGGLPPSVEQSSDRRVACTAGFAMLRRNLALGSSSD